MIDTMGEYEKLKETHNKLYVQFEKLKIVRNFIK